VDRQLWLAIANLYNGERQQQLDEPGLECGPEILERWLNQSATWIRAYLYPPVESLNLPKPGLESGSEIQDSLTDEQQDSLLGDLIAQEEQEERQTQRSQLQDALVDAIAKLEAKSQELLRLYYQEGKTQQQIMQELQMSQATVSRRLTKTRESLLTALVQWSQATLNISPNPNLIKDMSAALEEWLGGYYGVPNSSSDSQFPIEPESR
jgi:RNA polymerase sigma factor (sigma-70 family)